MSVCWGCRWGKSDGEEECGIINCSETAVEPKGLREMQRGSRDESRHGKKERKRKNVTKKCRRRKGRAERERQQGERDIWFGVFFTA